MLVVIVTKVGHFTDSITNGIIAFAGLFCYLYYLIRGNKRIRKKSIVYGSLMSSFLLISYFYNGNANIVNVLWVWSYLGVALLLYEFGVKKIYALAIFVIYIFFFSYDYFVNGIAIEDLLHSGSVNNISTLCIFAVSIYYISKYKDNVIAKIDYWPIILIAALSVITATRSSLFALAIFFVYSFFYNTYVDKNKGRNLLILLGVVAIAAYLYLSFFDDFGGAIEAKSERYGMESVRTEIWHDYFTGMFENIGNFVFGVPGNDTHYKYLSSYSGNTHNAFLMLHAKFGICGFCIFSVMLIKAFIKSIKRRELILFGVLMLVSLRSSFDWTAFPGILDVIFWFFFIYSIDRRCLISSESFPKTYTA